jgi:REP element-mobilizing transposase RayT
MSRKYKFKDQNSIYFVTFSVIHWLDIFIRNEYKDIVLESWKYCIAEKGMDLYSWCIMTSHIHMIIASHGNRLENIMRDMKTHTSKKIRDAIIHNSKESRRGWLLEMMRKAGTINSNNKDFQFWQQDNHPIKLLNAEMIHQKLEYIHNNPVVAGIVKKPEDYLYSSAGDYCGQKGLIDITLVEPAVISF